MTAPRKGAKKTGQAAKGFQPTEDMRVIVSAAAQAGVPAKRIAKLIYNPKTGNPIGLETLYNHFKPELEDKGAAVTTIAVGTLVKSMMAGGREGNSAAMFWLKTQAGFHERLQIEAVEGLDKLDDDDAARVANAVLASAAQNESARDKLRTATIDDEPAGTA